MTVCMYRCVGYMLIALQDIVSSLSGVSNSSLSTSLSSNPNLTAGFVTTLDWLQREKRFGSNSVAEDGIITEKVLTSMYVCVHSICMCMHTHLYVCMYNI